MWMSPEEPQNAGTIRQIGIDSLELLNAVKRDIPGFKPLDTATMKSISDRTQVFRTSGFWVPARG
jgi:hypothetical protein